MTIYPCSLGVFQNFSVEIMLESRGELDLEYLRSRVDKAGGSVYGTGSPLT